MMRFSLGLNTGDELALYMGSERRNAVINLLSTSLNRVQ